MREKGGQRPCRLPTDTFLATLCKGPWHREVGWFFHRLGGSDCLEASELHLPERRTDSLWVSYWPLVLSSQGHHQWSHKSC